MTGTWIKRIALAALLAAIAGGFYLALRERPVAVDAARIEEGPMQVSVREEGMTRVRDIYAVSAPIAGNLSRTVLREGDRVEAGRTVVASIHPLEPPLIDRRTRAELVASRDAARAGVGIAEVELQRAESALRLAREELARALRLRGPGVISESALQRINTEVESQQAAVEAARATIALRQAELATAEARLMQPEDARSTAGECCVDIVAPVDGRVLSVLVRSEQAVTAGTRVAELGDTADLEVVVDLLSADAVRIAPGTRATVSDWGGDATLAATVRRVDPAAFTKVSALGIEEQRVNAVLDLDEKDERLGHAYRVFVEIAIWSCDACVKVPIGALFRNGGHWNVFVVEGDRLRQAQVWIDRMNDEVAQVTGGLAAGDLVVLHPGDTLEDGSLVSLRPD